MSTLTLSDSLPERESHNFKSVSSSFGAHYIIYSCSGLEALKEMFPNPKDVNELNFVLFSTSGIHGSYTTIEEIEKEIDGYTPIELTFLIIQPRLVCVRYGVAEIITDEDLEYVKALRENSQKVVANIGRGKEK